jgi:phosphodiesterase/alkaline phosphatase D-like protein
MSASNVSFAHGVASGDPYADSVILWTRISPPDGLVGSLDVQWQIATSADFAPGSIKGSGSFSTSAARDWTVKVEAAGLSADTTYFYRFSSGNTGSSVGQTKTLPVNSDPVRLAVFSCSNFTAAQQFDAYARAAAINSANPYDAWLHLGDYIYEYGAGGYGAAEDAAGSRGFLPDREILSLGDYRQRYAQYHTDAGLLALRAAAPLIAGWDDHETANDSWSGGAENHQGETEGDWIARRDAALKAYYEWIPIREPGQRQASDGASALSPLTQAYRSFNFGDVLSLHMLETRLTARDEQLAYPDAAAVEARIGAILVDPAQVAAYATQLGLTPPTNPAAIETFAAALAPAVTQELVIATVQKAWGDPNRDLIGDTQMAWLQQQMASSPTAWQVLGQQVLMQSMAVPAELLLNAGNPALLDKYAGPLQKLATGTAFASLSPAEQALFAESSKIPYNLDAWDGYGVERETILQTALALGKRLISLAGDTHNAWAGVLDTMSAGSKPAGTVAGVEFATPGVTSPGLEKYLPGADAYIRTKYPAVDGLDSLFQGYVSGLNYADLNRRGYLDLTVSKEQAVGSFQFLNGTDAVSGQPLWSSESVVASASYGLSTTAEARPLITWQPGWRELDLNFGLAFDATAAPTRLDPAAYASVPRDGVQLADVRVQGSDGADRVVVGTGATVEAGAGSDELDNTDSRGGNVLAGGVGTDLFLLRAAGDTVIGGDLLANASGLGLPAVVGQVDGERDVFLIDSSNPSPEGTLGILDFELGRDELLLDGLAPTGSWSTVRQLLQGLGITVNAAPQLGAPLITLSLQPGVEESRDLGYLASDPDGNPLQLVKLDGPAWVTTSGTTVKATAPIGSSEEQLAALTLRLAFSDDLAAVPLAVRLTLNKAPSALTLANTVSSLAENSSTASRIKVADIVITDDASGSNTITLSGADAANFEVSGNALFLKAGTALNFEAKTSYAVSVSASDATLPGITPVSAAFTLTVTNVNEPPTAIALSANTIAENTLIGTGVKIGNLSVTDPDASGNNNVLTLQGADAVSFQIRNGNELFFTGASPNFESKNAYSLTVKATDGALSFSQPLTVNVSDRNEAPTAISLSLNTNLEIIFSGTSFKVGSLPESTSTANRIKVAEILISDDALGSNIIELSGADAASFEVIGTGLFLKAGTPLDFETKPTYNIILSARDPALTGTLGVISAFQLVVRDVPETPGSFGVTTTVEITLPSGEIRSIPVTISNADLAPGSNLAVIRDLGINPAGLKTLAEFGVKANGTGLDFKLKVNPGANSSLNAGLELVAADLLPQLTDPSGRRPDRKLLFYGVTGSGALLPLTYDPITGAGGRFYDLDNNGTADFFALSLIDGGFGDKDGVQNGIIDDPSFAGFADLSNLRFSNAGSGTITISDPGNAAPAAVNLRASLSARPSSANQIGYVVLNPAEVARADSLLSDLNWLRGRARTLVSTLESTDVSLPAGSTFERDLQLINGQSLRFFEVVDASLNELSSLSDSRFRLLSPTTIANGQVAFSSTSGVNFSLDLLPADPNLNALIGNAQGLAPVLDLSAFTTAQNLSGTVTVGREADFNSSAGFYHTLDAAGTVLAVDGITRLRPGDSAYAAEALRTSNLIAPLSNLSVADDQTASRGFSSISGGSFLAPFAQVNGNTFFAFGAANSDGLSHFRSLGTNLIGLEDILGGGDRDFDDLVIGVNFTQIV